MTFKRTRAAMTLCYAAYIFVLMLYVLSTPPFICVSTLVCAFIHEICHIACAYALGRQVRPLAFSCVGLYPELGAGSDLSCILIYAAGPLFNVCVCFGCLCILKMTQSEWAFELFSVNAALAVYNLTPVPYSDGGGILNIALCFVLGRRRGGTVCYIIWLVCSFMLFVLFSFRFFIYGAGFFSFYCSFLFVMNSISRLSGE